MIDINKKSEEIFNNIKKYIQAKYVKKQNEQVEIKKNIVDNTYPLVVFETNANTSDYITQDTFRLDQVRNLSFEISIFAININQINSSVICDELANLVCQVMNVYYGMQGGIDAKLKNINPAKATKYVLHFNCKWNVKQNTLY